MDDFLKLGGVIVKPDRDEDFYVRWSTVAEGPTHWGSRAEMLALGVPEERLERADLDGTSSTAEAGRVYSWDDVGFLMNNLQFREPPLWLQRGDLRHYVELLSSSPELAEGLLVSEEEAVSGSHVDRLLEGAQVLRGAFADLDSEEFLKRITRRAFGEEGLE